MRTLAFVLLLFSSTAFAQDGGSAACPARREAVKEGTACRQPCLSCSYGEASSCLCTPRPCISPAGPIPNCKPSARWVCRDDGCPSETFGTCAQPGKRCAYDDGLCAETMTCTDAGWELERRNCRPSARPRR